MVFRSAATAISGVGTSPTATEPAGTVPGDLLLALVEVDGAAITPPATWLNLFAVTPSSDRYRVEYLIRGPSAPSFTWTYTGSVYREVHILCFKTPGGAIAVDSKSTIVSGVTGVTTIDPPATIALAGTSLALAIAADSTFTAITVPSGYVKRSTDGFDNVLADKSLGVPGSEDPGTFGGVGAGAGEWYGATATFTDATGTTPLVAHRPAPWTPSASTLRGF